MPHELGSRWKSCSLKWRKQIKPPALRDFAFTDHMTLLIPTESEGGLWPVCSKTCKISLLSAVKCCDGSYPYIAGEETEALRHHEIVLRSHINQYRGRGKSWFLALCIKHWVNNLSFVRLWCVDSLPSSMGHDPMSLLICHGPAMQSELLVIHLSLMGGLKHKCQLGEGCGV